MVGRIRVRTTCANGKSGKNSPSGQGSGSERNNQVFTKGTGVDDRGSYRLSALLISLLMIMLGAAGCGSTDQTAGDGRVAGSDTDAQPTDAATTEPSDVDKIPGSGVVDQPVGEMHSVPPFEPQAGVEGLTPGEPVRVVNSRDSSQIGWVDWDDFYPVLVPVDASDPPPMVPVGSKDGDQIGWWAYSLGWVTFDQVKSPDFDYAEVWSRAQEGKPPLDYGTGD